MAVLARWQCDRDGSMFDNKKDADAHDKMLELGEHFSAFLSKHAESLSEEDAERIGLLLARNRESVMTACKGRPEVLLELGAVAEPGADRGADKVTPLAARAKA